VRAKAKVRAKERKSHHSFMHIH